MGRFRENGVKQQSTVTSRFTNRDHDAVAQSQFARFIVTVPRYRLSSSPGSFTVPLTLTSLTYAACDCDSKPARSVDCFTACASWALLVPYEERTTRCACYRGHKERAISSLEIAATAGSWAWPGLPVVWCRACHHPSPLQGSSVCVN
jgi:hypothetical protein